VSISIGKEVLVCFFIQALMFTFHCTGSTLISVVVVNTDCAVGCWAALPLSARKLLPLFIRAEVSVSLYRQVITQTPYG
jgi:hypothetical protein